jgi:hypothetical protein
MSHLDTKPERRAPGALARSGNRGRANLTHHATESPHRPVRGARTKTDREPMSTPEYHGHMRRIG